MNIFRKGKLTIGKGNRLLYRTSMRYIFCERFISEANNTEKGRLWRDASFIESIFNYVICTYMRNLWFTCQIILPGQHIVFQVV